MEYIFSYFYKLPETRQTFIILMMGCAGFIILILAIKRWLINRWHRSQLLD